MGIGKFDLDVADRDFQPCAATDSFLHTTHHINECGTVQGLLFLWGPTAATSCVQSANIPGAYHPGSKLS